MYSNPCWRLHKNFTPRFIWRPFSLKWKIVFLMSVVKSIQWKPSGEDSKASIRRPSSSSFFGTQRRILEDRKYFSIKIGQKDLRQEALRLKADQARTTTRTSGSEPCERGELSLQTRKSLARALFKDCDNASSSKLLNQTWKYWNSERKVFRALFKHCPA